MANPLVPCLGCGRHVRVSDASCPFCGQMISDEQREKVIPSAAQRLGRNAMFVFATTLALGACSPAQQPSDAAADGAQQDTGGIIAMYGAPAPDAQADAGPQDTGGNMALYGSPVPVDASPDSAMVDDGGGIGPLYGGPFPGQDGGDDSGDGNPGLRYGAPPPSSDV